MNISQETIKSVYHAKKPRQKNEIIAKCIIEFDYEVGQRQIERYIDGSYDCSDKRKNFIISCLGINQIKNKGKRKFGQTYKLIESPC